MNFNDLVKERCEKIVSVLASKEKEYAAGEDRFHNFKVAGRISDCSPEKALKGMWMKHIVSVFDLIDWCDSETEKLTSDLIDEKIGDSINYLVLLEGMLKDRVVRGVRPLPVFPISNNIKPVISQPLKERECYNCNNHGPIVSPLCDDCIKLGGTMKNWEAKDVN